MDHSNYSPSRLSRIIKCPGSVGLIDDLMISDIVSEAKPSSYAAHGTELHIALENSFTNDIALTRLDVDDKFLVTECLDYLKVLKKSKGPGILYEKSEHQIDLKRWGIPDVWGTLDYSIIDPIKRHIDIIDWKFGAGVPVYAKENSQLLAYAAGEINWPTTIQTVTLHIVQPAIDNYSTWDLSVFELYEWVHGTLAMAIGKCLTSKEFNPGVEQCRWCEAQNHCRTRLDYAMDIAIRLFDAKANLATCPDPEELVKLIDKAPLVEKAIKEIRLYIQTEMLRGVVFPGVKLVEGRSNRKWIDEKETVIWMALNTEIDDLYIPKIKSPSQFEKELKALKKNDKFKELFEQPPGKITLVSESDKRPAVNTTSGAIDVFQDYQAQDKLE